MCVPTNLSLINVINNLIYCGGNCNQQCSQVCSLWNTIKSSISPQCTTAGSHQGHKLQEKEGLLHRALQKTWYNLLSVLLPSHSVCIFFLFQSSKFCLLMECGHAGNIIHLLFSLKPDQNYSAVSEKPGHCAFCFSRDELIQTGSVHRKDPSCQHSPFIHWFIPTPIFCSLH